MNEQQYHHEVMAQLEQLEYNTNLGIGELSVTTFIHSRRNCNTDGKIRKVGQKVMPAWKVKSY